MYIYIYITLHELFFMTHLQQSVPASSAAGGWMVDTEQTKMPPIIDPGFKTLHGMGAYLIDWVRQLFAECQTGQLKLI